MTQRQRRPGLLVVTVATATLLAAGCLAPSTPEDDVEQAGNVPDESEPEEPGQQEENSDADSRQDPDDVTLNETLPHNRTDAPWLGAWLGGWPNSENQALADFHQRTDDRLDTVNLLVSWNTSYGTLDDTLTHVASAGATPLITWNPTNLTTEQIEDGDTELTLDNNETVTVDEHIDAYVDGLCQFEDHTGNAPLLEPMPEPNGDWHPWAIGHRNENGTATNSPDSYKDAWVKIQDRFDRACPDGVRFVWTINGVNQNGTAYMETFPGEESVDLVGIRGLNLGDHQPQGWAHFGGTFGEAYCTVTSQTELDIALTAVGSVEEGGDKARWIQEAYRNASSHHWSRIEGIVWYDDLLTGNGTRTLDVSLSSSPQALEAYKDAVHRVRSDEAPDGDPAPC